MDKYKPVVGKLKVHAKPGSLNSDQFTPKKIYNQSHLNDFTIDYQNFGEYKERSTSLTFDMLKQVPIAVAPIGAIINTRVNQIGLYTSRAKNNADGMGFEVRLSNKSKEPDEEQLENISKIEEFIANCGNGVVRDRDGFDTFIRKITRDTLTYDQVNFEITYDKDDNIQAFYAVDPCTIKPVLEDFEPDPELGLVDKEEIAFVQVVDNEQVAAFNKNEMAFAVRNPRTDINIQPYGLSEIEIIVKQMSSYLEAEEYNARYFQQGGMAKGILNIKQDPAGMGDRQTLESFKRQWRTQVTGQKGAWKIPILELPGELEFINIAQSGGEMVFEKWMNYLINITCGVYQIDPAEINFPNNGGVGGHGNSLFNGDGQKVDYSKEKGLKPLMQFIENTINKYIVSHFSNDYVFAFKGLDDNSEDKMVDIVKRKTESYMTINEVRQELGLPALENGDIVANPYFMQSKQMGGGGDGGGFDFDFGEEDEPLEEPEEEQGQEEMLKSIITIEDIL